MTNKKVVRLTITALMAALCYVAFSFLQIKIPTPAGYSSFHLGNVFLALAAMILGGIPGGIAGSIGMGIGDLLDPAYVVTAPKTLFLKFTIGFVTGYMAHKVFRINELEGMNLKKKAAMSIGAGALYNIVAEPLVSFLYYKIMLGNETKAMSYLVAAKWITTSINALLTFVIATVLYLELRRRMPSIKELSD